MYRLALLDSSPDGGVPIGQHLLLHAGSPPAAAAVAAWTASCTCVGVLLESFLKVA